MTMRLLFVLGTLIIAEPAWATHHLLKRALQQANCIPHATQQILNDGVRAIYDVTCVGSSPGRVTIVCTSFICLRDSLDMIDELDETP
jgi:hypothetical protein